MYFDHFLIIVTFLDEQLDAGSSGTKVAIYARDQNAPVAPELSGDIVDKNKAPQFSTVRAIGADHGPSKTICVKTFMTKVYECVDKAIEKMWSGDGTTIGHCKTAAKELNVYLGGMIVLRLL